MKQPLLITKAKVEEFLQVAVGYSAKEFERFIREAQEFDLKPLLCDSFYYEMLENALVDPFDKVITGQNYEHNGKTYYHEGLEAVLAYFTYARFIMKSNAVSTSHGMVTKKNPSSSEPLSQTEKKDLYFSHRQDANKLFQGVKTYMDFNKINYNDCNTGCNGSTVSGDIETRSFQW